MKKFSKGLIATIGVVALAGGTAFYVGQKHASDDTRTAEAPGGARASQGGAAGGGAARGAGRRGGFSPTVSVIRAKAEPVTRRTDAIGQARAIQGAQLAAEAAGRVVEVAFEPGQLVSKGDVLLRLEDDAQQIAFDRAKAQIDIARANRQRYRGLSDVEAASALEIEAAETAYNVALAEFRRAEFDLEQRRVIAPFDGRAGLTDIERGDYLRVGDPVTTLDGVSAIVVSFLIPEEASSAVEMGQPVMINPVGSPERLEGAVSAIDSRVDPESRTLRIEATAPDETGAVTPGSTVMVTTLQEGVQAIAVPGLAIQWDRNGAYIWRVADDGSAERLRVAINQRNDETVLVSGEVKPGDIIISESADRVRPGMRFPQYARERSSSGAGSAGAAR